MRARVQDVGTLDILESLDGDVGGSGRSQLKLVSGADRARTCGYILGPGGYLSITRRPFEHLAPLRVEIHALAQYEESAAAE